MMAQGIQCLEKHPSGNGHELQLWIEPKAGGFVFVIRNAYAPKGFPIKSAVLDSGPVTEYETAMSDGQSTFAAFKK